MMKTFLLLVMLPAPGWPALAQKDPTQYIKASDFRHLKWLEGTWQRTNLKPGKTAHERWEPSSRKRLVGYGVSMSGADTTFLEKLQIVVADKKIYYVADVPENPAPVYFLLTDLGPQGFVCENPDHDFPKKISYRREGEKLMVQISGDGSEVNFEFVKK